MPWTTLPEYTRHAQGFTPWRRLCCWPAARPAGPPVSCGVPAPPAAAPSEPPDLAQRWQPLADQPVLLAASAGTRPRPTAAAPRLSAASAQGAHSQSELGFGYIDAAAQCHLQLWSRTAAASWRHEERGSPARAVVDDQPQRPTWQSQACKKDSASRAASGRRSCLSSRRRAAAGSGPPPAMPCPDCACACAHCQRA